ncbi:Cytidine and deoxycytidylate deaminase zinc-binding region [Nakaseomyces glabratus]|nr:Cytidine and deoxycytidylate deaminase zinc-binding region [Nakaseomyces glabratus]KAH7602474.1 Cytidine and deoxycytidylate deaminase zinc-binding region [Nakaseomyces glabratus]KAH7603476.1 Cytidine and deoxycytidylate deaminase zinc-binding region [Nakaseomyces glabratus]KAH7606999.1 Cytidine and deoxycytidylate deaminase zinc-binding region [Nakaseomyces glabratus]KAH7613864.1 Cytidine and deoxycytidylate deaminase zinc-binding region [Nakaseomyces glabratus]
MKRIDTRILQASTRRKCALCKAKTGYNTWISVTDMEDSELELLRQGCLAAKDVSYSPYSRYRVGCCILVRDGERVIKVTGANVENASYGGTICAERVAITKAMTTVETRDPSQWVALGIMGDSLQDCISPCGICRQVIREFVNPKTGQVPIVMFNGDGSNYKKVSLEEILPMSFGPESLAL